MKRVPGQDIAVETSFLERQVCLVFAVREKVCVYARRVLAISVVGRGLCVCVCTVFTVLCHLGGGE